jgi:hypothetical protein
MYISEANYTAEIYLRCFTHTALRAKFAKGLSDRKLHAQSLCLIKLIIFKPLRLNLNRRDTSSVAGEKMVENSSMMKCRLVLRYNWRFIYDYICLWLQGWCVVGEGCIHTYVYACIHSAYIYPIFTCIYMYIHIYVHTYMPTYIRTFIPTYTRTYINKYVRTYIHIYLHTYVRTYIHTYVHTYMRTCIHTYIPTYIRTYINKYVRTYIHTYIHICLHTYVGIYIHTYVRTYMHTYIHRGKSPIMGRFPNMGRCIISYQEVLRSEVKDISSSRWGYSQ